MSEQKKLQDIRIAQGLTQFQLAVRAGVSLSTITSIETSRHDVRIAQARKIADALGVRVDDIAWPESDEIKRPVRKKEAA